MDNEGRFWVSIIAIIAITFISIVVAVISYNRDVITVQYNTIQAVVQQGYDPVTARCVVTKYTEAGCALLAERKGVTNKQGNP